MKKSILIAIVAFFTGVCVSYCYLQFKDRANFHKQVMELNETNFLEKEEVDEVSLWLNDHETSFTYGKNQTITVNIKNTSEDKIYQVGYTNLEIYYKGTWRELIFTQGRALPLLILKPSDEHIIDKIDIDIAPYNISLKKGHYRIVVNVTEDQKYYNKGIASVEFDIK